MSQTAPRNSLADAPFLHVRNRRLWNGVLLVSLVAAAILVWVVLPARDAMALKGLVAITSVLNRFVILAPLIEDGINFSPWFLAGMMVVIETWMGALVIANADYLFKVPWLGPRVVELEIRGHEALEARPWLRRTATAGLIVFMAIPIPGTNAVGAAVVGRLIGLSPERTLFAVVAGSLVSCFAIALGADGLTPLVDSIRDNRWFHAGRWVVLGLVVVLIGVSATRRRGTPKVPPRSRPDPV